MTGFFDGGSKAISFGMVNDQTWFNVWQGGIILNISEPVQTTDYNDQTKPKYFKNGEVIMKILVTVDTRSGRCPAPPLDPEDDGTRVFHIEKGSGLLRSIGKTLRAKSMKDLQVGGELYAAWTGGVGVKGDAREYGSEATPAPAGGGMFTQEAAAPAPVAAPAPQPVTPTFPTQQPMNSGPGTPIQGGFDPRTGQPIAPSGPTLAPERFIVSYDPTTGAPVYNDQQTAPQPVPAAAPAGNPFAKR